MPPIGTEESATQSATVSDAVVSGVSRVNADGTTSPIRVDEGGTQNVEATRSSSDDRERAAGLDTKSLEDVYDKITGTDTNRDPGGRFKAKTDEQTDQQVDQSQQTTTTTPATMPKSWPAEKAALWDKIPDPEVRAFITERETKAHSVISQQGQALSRFKPVSDMIVSHKDVFEGHNVNPVTGLSRLLAVQRKLDENPGDTILAIAQAYGVDLGQLVGGRQTARKTSEEVGEGEEVAIPAHIAEVIEEIREAALSTSERLTARERAEAEQRAREDARQDRMMQTDIETWAKDKPHYNDVRKRMSMMVLSGDANTLDEAYDMACNADPVIRKAIREAEGKAEADKRRVAEERRVTDAKRNASVQVRSPPNVRPAASGGKWDSNQYLEQTFDKIVSK